MVKKLKNFGLLTLFSLFAIGVALAQVAGIFSTLQVNSAVSSTAAQGAILGWNTATLGETDLVNVKGSGIGGFNWYNIATAGTPSSTLMSLTPAGNLTVAQVTANVTGNLTGNASGTQATYSNVNVNGNNTLSLTGTSGLNLGWNQSSGGGESDFVNLSNVTSTAFNWYHTLTHTIGSPIMSLTPGGNLTVATVTANLTGNVTGNTAGTHTGAVVGNASTASALATTPTSCPNGESANGIAANGNATGSNCNTLTLWATTSSVCATGTSAGTSCTGTLSWDSPGFSGAPSRFMCQGVSPSGAPQGPFVTSMSGSTIGYQISNGTASQAVASSFGSVYCWGRQ